MLVRLTMELSGRFDVVAEAGSGREAIALAAEHQPDLVVLDVSMPEMDGLEALPAVRAAAPAAEIAVVSGVGAGRVAGGGPAPGAAGAAGEGGAAHAPRR